MVTRILRVLLLTFFALLLSAGPAAADCESVPPPNTPNEGSWGAKVEERPYPMFSETPESVEDATGPNPFADGSETTVYHEYGWGSWKVHNYDPPDEGVPGCADNRMVAGWINKVVNFMFNLATFAGAFTVIVVRLVFDPLTLAVFDPIVRLFTDVTNNRLFIPLFPIALTLTAIYVASRAREGDIKTAGKDAGGALGIAVLALICGLYGLTIAPVIDRTVTGGVAAVGEAVVNPIDEDASRLPGGNYQGEPMPLPDAIGANLVEAILFPMWCSAQLGPSSGATADEYCDDLFMASTLSRTEAAAIAQNPSLAEDIYEAKEDDYNDVADDIEDADARAYSYLSGARVADRIPVMLLGLLAMGIATFMLAFSMARVFYSLLVLRFTFGVFPLLAIAAQAPQYRHLAAKAGDWVWSALVNGLVFSVVSLVWIAGGLGGLLSPSSGVPLSFALLVMLLGTVAAWKLAKRISLAGGLRIKKRTPEPFRERPWQNTDKGAPDAAGSDDPSGGPSAPEAPRDTAMPRRSLVVGAAQGAARTAATTAVLGLVTGGGATVGGAAAGAAMGAYATHRENKARKEGATAAAQPLPYYPATTRRHSPSRTHQPLPAGNPSRAKALTPAQTRANLPAEARTRAARSSTTPVQGTVVYHPAPARPTPVMPKRPIVASTAKAALTTATGAKK